MSRVVEQNGHILLFMYIAPVNASLPDSGASSKSSVYYISPLQHLFSCQSALILFSRMFFVFFLKKKLAYFPFLFHSVVSSWLQELITRETLILIHELSLSHTESLRFSETKYVIESHRSILNEVCFLIQVYTHVLTLNWRLSSQRSALRVVLQIAQNLKAVSCSFRSARGLSYYSLNSSPTTLKRK